MAWLFWLSGPVVATLVAAVASWLRGRPDPVPGTNEAMRAHTDYLDALAQGARSRDRGLRTGRAETHSPAS